MIDDGNTDDTVDAAQRLVLPAPTVLTVVRQPHAGASAARNAGLAATQQPVVAFLDADDVWGGPHKLAATYNALIESGAVLACHDFTILKQGRRETIQATRYARKRISALEALYVWNFICTSTVLARRDVLLEAGGFAVGAQFGEDYHLWLSVLEKHPDGLCALGAPLTLWRDHPGGLSRQKPQLYGAMLRFALRHVGPLWRYTWRAPFRLLERVAVIHISLLRMLAGGGEGRL